MALEIRPVTGEPEHRQLAGAWHTLAEEDARTPFQHPAWHDTWWRLVGDRRAELERHTLCFLDGGTTVALAPLALEREDGETVARFATDPWADYLDLLVDRRRTSYRAVAGELLSYLAAGLGRRWSRVELREIPADSPLTEATAGYPVLGATLERTAGAPCPRLDLTDPEALARAGDKKEYAVKERRLRRLGRLTCHHWLDAADIVPRMPSFMAMHLRQWLGRPDRGITFDMPEVARFYSQGAAPLAGAGLLLLAELCLDERPIAYYLGFLRRRTFWGYRTTFETELARHSPGHVLHRLMFDILRRQGFVCFDFMRGDFGYKHRYANRQPVNVDLRLTPEEAADG